MSTAKGATKGSTFTINGEEYTVGAPCADDSGVWACGTHGETFPHNFAKDNHLTTPGDHELVWMCHKHGAEAP